MEKTLSKIVVNPENCTGCLVCQLQCSFFKTGLFNPSAAKIVVDWVDDTPRITFTDDCDECGLCARFCAYGALVLGRRK